LIVNPFDVHDRRVLVTGATRGIGLGVARAFAHAGAETILVGRDEKQLNHAAEELRTSARPVHVSAFDLRDTAGIAGWFEALCEKP
jgi:3-oxoacyl-[acyl-carrier protein] reductase